MQKSSVASYSDLKESLELFETIIQQASVGITIFRGRNFMVEMANKTYTDIIDIPIDRLVGRPLFDSIPEVAETVAPLLNRVMDTGIPFHATEFRVPLKRHGIIDFAYFNFVYQPLRDADGTIDGIIVVANEVTEQVLAKHAIAESEKSFRNMVMQSPIGMVIFRGEDYIIEMPNQTLLDKIWHRRESEVTGKKALEVFPELNDQKYPALLKQVRETGAPYREKESLAFVKGDEGMKQFYFDFEYAPLYDTSGRVDGIMITVTDVTERVETRQYVTEAAERLRLATEGTQLAIWDLSLKTYEVIYSPRLRELFDYHEEGVFTHQKMREQIHPEDRVTIVEKAFEEAIRTGKYFYEARVVLHDKSVRWIRTHGKVYYDEAGNPVRMLGTSVDIDDLKQHEQLRDDFIKMASHELKTPVTSIKGYVQLLMKKHAGDADPLLTSSLVTIDKQISKLTKLITDLLDVTKIETGGLQLNREQFSLATLALEQVRDIQATTQTHTLELTINYDPDIIADRDRIGQVLNNLMTNAIKYSPGGEKVRIIISRKDSNVVLSVIDQGIGISVEDHTKIFDRFYRVQGKDEKTYPGFGIGLFIVNQIMLDHGGKVWVESEKGKGTVFSISLPTAGKDGIQKQSHAS